MNRKPGVIACLVILAAVANVAAAGATTMVVRSSSTLGELDALSRRTDVIADVLTIDRREYLLRLDGETDGEFSGRTLTPDSVRKGTAPTIRIPLDQVAIVYYRHVAAGDSSPLPELNYPVKEHYPSLANVGAAEADVECGDLDKEIARAGALRWYARQQGAAPFTEHEALVQHGKNTAKYTGEGILMAIALVGLAGGGGGGGWGGPDVETQASTEAFRWAVTAADRRETGLLQLKQTRACPAVDSPDGATTDLEVLSEIETSRMALVDHQITDVEQRDQQKQLLDRLDPPVSATVLVATAAEFAAATAAVNDQKGEQLGGPTLVSHKQYALVELKGSSCSYPRFGWPLAGRPTQMGGPIEVRERALTWTRPESNDVESLQFKDIEELRPIERHVNWAIPIRRAGGSCQFIFISDYGPQGSAGTREIQEEVRTTILAHMTGTPN